MGRGWGQFRGSKRLQVGPNQSSVPIWERFASEEPALRPLPEVAFEARRLQPVSVSRSALVRVEGAWYSVPERWAGLSVTAWLGVEEVTFSLGTELA